MRPELARTLQNNNNGTDGQTSDSRINLGPVQQTDPLGVRDSGLDYVSVVGSLVID